MNLRLRLLLSGAGLSLLGAIVAAAALWQGTAQQGRASEQALRAQALLTQHELQGRALQQEVQSRLGGLRALAAQPGTVEALRQFKAALRLMDENAASGTSGAAMREEMLGWLAQQYKAEWAVHNVEPPPELTPVLDARSLTTALLQQEFIARNPQPPGRKDLMVYPDTPTPYGQVHAQYHRAFDRAQDQLGVQDLLLIDSDTDQIVYSVAKDIDFGMSLNAPLVLGSPLAAVYGTVRRARSADAMALSDLGPYLPAANRPVLFAAVPLFEGETQVGVLAWRVGIAQLTGMLAAGAAPRADSFLVGSDKQLRSDPRALLGDTSAYIGTQGRALSAEARALALHRGSGIGLLPVDSPAVAAALQGQSGSLAYVDAQGREQQAAYGPVQLEGQRWALVTLAAADGAADARLDVPWPLLWRALLAAAAAALLGAALMTALQRGWLKPLAVLRTTLQRALQGELQARTGLAARDELGALGRSLDELLDSRQARLEAATRENDQLNESVVRLLQTVFQMANKDLGARAEVSEDLTGTLASAVNQLGHEMSRTLAQVQDIAAQVREASEFVGEQAVRVDETAQDEREALAAMAGSLGQATYQLAQVGALADNSGEAAVQASAATESALAAVEASVHGTRALGESMLELEKRFKRLGTRSQEISAVVSLMSQIAERTHVLALNAAMQASSAGEAGRGFALVADEVQRLAESARQATGQIAHMVQGVQVETGDTLLSVNRLMVQVDQQSALARQAGERMAETRDTTQHLVGLVRQIATFSQQQSALAHELRQRVDQLHRGSAQTILAIEQQTESTATLVDFARRLSESVGQFNLGSSDPAYRA
ncbi:methyl-accepting chemotaxis protein [Aquabacterium sp. A7-Y]|uniref:methyl-accepting chemotaxis protein n=1 Tax=Aquabacterium sp. A7-Y TaxID=1349605 RepID=UPI00223E42A2|nr:methyl-accepting chemotaxis protein [Aquabacterium sp. A7-Y]MCW7540044.1 methyl-accepting chemotaxis protein [Aquabacterium sp. A7-Y]